DDPPGLLGLITADRQRGVLVQHVEQQRAVGRQARRRQLRIQRDRGQDATLPADGVELEADALRVQPETEHVGCYLGRHRQMRHLPEPDRYLFAVAVDSLSGAEPEQRV